MKQQAEAGRRAALGPDAVSRRLRDGPRQLFQTYGFVAREAPEEDEESAAAKVAAAAAAAAAAEAEATPLRRPPAAASSNKSCYSLD